jgi:hypothetical protein
VTLRTILIVLLVLAARSGRAQTFDLRMVIGMDVTCRSEPSRSSAAAASPRLGEVLRVLASRVGDDQEHWHLI